MPDSRMTYAQMVERFPIGCEVAQRNLPGSPFTPEWTRVVGHCENRGDGWIQMMLLVKHRGEQAYRIPCLPDDYVPVPDRLSAERRRNAVTMARLLSQLLPLGDDELQQQAEAVLAEAGRLHDFDLLPIENAAAGGPRR